MAINDILQKSRDAEPFDKDELIEMLSFPPDSTESYLLMAEANRISKELTANKAEVHAQFSLNLAPCPCNCSFCSFAKSLEISIGMPALFANLAASRSRHISLQKIAQLS